MYAKQYEVTLPADYDMAIIRKRVVAGAPLLDDRAGLGIKAWLLRERGIDGSPVNQYTCFYLWHEAGEMARFLVGGGGFQNIIRDFGRPTVLHGIGLATLAGPARDSTPRAASRRLTTIPLDPDSAATGLGLTDFIEQEIEQLNTLARRPGVHTAALVLDPDRWRLLKFVLWDQAVPREEDATERYQALYLSTPGLENLPRGRHW